MINLELILHSLPQLLWGAVLSIQLVIVSGIIGLIIAVPLALARVSPNPLISAGPYAYAFFFRGTPLLVQLFLVYYGLGQFEFVRNSVLWPFLREPYYLRDPDHGAAHRRLYRRDPARRDPGRAGGGG